MTATLHRKKNEHSQQKEYPNTCLSRKMILLLPKPHRKTPYGARRSLSTYAPLLSPQTPYCADRRPSLIGYHFSSFNLAMKTLFLLFLAALGFTACTRRVVEHVEVHDTLHHSISDTLREFISLTDSVFIHDSTFTENGIPVRSRLIFHRQLIDRTSQHLHQSEREHARRQKTQHSAVRSVPFPFPGATKSWLWVIFGVGVGLGIGKVAWKR